MTFDDLVYLARGVRTCNGVRELAGAILTATTEAPFAQSRLGLTVRRLAGFLPGEMDRAWQQRNDPLAFSLQVDVVLSLMDTLRARLTTAGRTEQLPRGVHDALQAELAQSRARLLRLRRVTLHPAA